jgi:GTPase SAR1 family protein
VYKRQLVIGENGTGKTTIVNKLKSNFPDYLIHPSGLYNLSFLIFFTQEDIMSRSDNTSELLLVYGIEKEDFDISLDELLEDFFPKDKSYFRLIDKNYPKATGEVVIMNLVINFAIRKFLRLDYPIVVEDLSVLDTNHLDLFISFVRKNCSQVILLSPPRSLYQQIGLNPDYYLTVDSKTNKSNILIADRDT